MQHKCFLQPLFTDMALCFWLFAALLQALISGLYLYGSHALTQPSLRLACFKPLLYMNNISWILQQMWWKPLYITSLSGLFITRAYHYINYAWWSLLCPEDHAVPFSVGSFALKCNVLPPCSGNCLNKWVKMRGIIDLHQKLRWSSTSTVRFLFSQVFLWETEVLIAWRSFVGLLVVGVGRILLASSFFFF